MKKLIIQIILAGIIIFLGYKCYESIKIPQQFKVIKEQRYARIADRLKDIRTAQEAYKGVYGKYTGSFDTLINFIKYDSVKVVRSIGSLSDEDLEKGITEAQAIKEGRNNRLILIGDVAQLPPVGLDISPALDRRELEAAYNFKVTEVALTDIMRQAEQSGILYNATQVRSLIGIGSENLRLRIGKFPDVFKIGGGELLEEIDSCYGRFGEEETIVVCRSNKRANRFNEGIRRTILYREEDFCSGDRIMIVKNNYFWGADYEKIDFIANGDMATVQRAGRRVELYGHHFVNATLKIDGYEEEVTAWVMLDTLMSDYPAMTYEQNRIFYQAVEADYADIPSKKKRFEKIRENEYYNALQLKFAYAVTCHKAQGGQWDAVFIDQGWLPEEMLNDEYWRWLYTAITRAQERVYFVNFKEEFFEIPV